MNFDLEVDLNPVFNWNVKQLFVYLAAEYETKKNEMNQVSLLHYLLQLDFESSKVNFTPSKINNSGKLGQITVS